MKLRDSELIAKVITGVPFKSKMEWKYRRNVIRRSPPTPIGVHNILL